MERATVIVALPPVDDRINKISSEEVAHLTLLYLGDVELSAEAMLYVQHACEELSPFGMTVDYRGTLGADEADVLFFEKNAWDMKRISEFRHYLLLNDEIKRAYDAAEQHTEYPDWTPHLTLGYPEKPAREMNEDEGRIYYVDFNRVAVWTGDFEGPEFRLKYDNYGMDVAMSALEQGALAASTIFGEDPNAAKQYGVKGMRWGVTTKDRAAQRTPTPVTTVQKKPGTYTKAKGGKYAPAHEDAIAALELRQKAKASTTDALSNSELQKVITRMNLENNYHSVSFNSDRRSKGQRFVQGLFGMKRYGKKRPYTDTHEQVGELTKETVKKSYTTANLMRAATKAAAAG